MRTVLLRFGNGRFPCSGDMKLTSASSYASLPCITRALYGTSNVSGAPLALVRIERLPPRIPSSLPLYVRLIALVSSYGARTSPRRNRTRRLGSFGRATTSRILTGSLPAFSSVSVRLSRSERWVATPKSTWSGE